MKQHLAITLIVISLWLPLHRWAVAADDVEVVTAGRLGGTLQTFIDRFGDPVEINQSAGPIFVTDKFGYLSVQVDRIQGTHGLEDRARVLTVSSVRPRDLPADAPADADWTIGDATEYVRSLLPTDAELSPAVADGSGQLAVDCQSAVLTVVFGAVSLGQCRVTFVMPTPDSVSFATIAMTAGAADTYGPVDSADECDGAIEWIRASGAILATIDDLLGRVASIDEANPGSAKVVSDLAARFRDLAGELRTSEPPGELSEARFYLVSGVTSYADGFDLASEAIETDDDQRAEEAVDALESAGKAVNNAIAAITLASENCGLLLGTPMAENN